MHRRFTTLILAGLPALAAMSPLPQDSAERHVADGSHVRVSTMWRSERALDYHAKVLASIGDAVVRSLPRFAGVPERAADAPLLPIVIHPTPPAFRRAVDADADAGTGSGDRKGRPKRGRKPTDPGAPVDAAPVPISRRGDPAAGGTVMANAPRVGDRTMFATGIQPLARWGVAIEAAHAGLHGAVELDASERDGAALLAAHAGLAEIGFAIDEFHGDPYVATGLARLRERLGARTGEARARALLAAAAEPPIDHLEYEVDGPFAASAPQAARALLRLGALRLGGSGRSADGGEEPPSVEAAERAAWAIEYLQEHPPAWSIEAGAVSSHPFGWHVVAPRRSDALVLSADPMGDRPFTLRTSFLLFGNDVGNPAQADLVLGDVGGDRYLLACNTLQGIYLFHRSGPGEPYEALTEFKEVPMPVGAPVDVVVRWDGEELAISVMGAELAKQTLKPGAMSGRYGFGAHANVSVLFSDLVVE